MSPNNRNVISLNESSITSIVHSACFIQKPSFTRIFCIYQLLVLILSSNRTICFCLCSLSITIYVFPNLHIRMLYMYCIFAKASKFGDLFIITVSKSTIRQAPKKASLFIYLITKMITFYTWKIVVNVCSQAYSVISIVVSF